MLVYLSILRKLIFVTFNLAKRTPGKSKEEAQMEKKQELEKRLEDVKGQLGNSAPPKKTPKKGIPFYCKFGMSFHCKKFWYQETGTRFFFSN